MRACLYIRSGLVKGQSSKAAGRQRPGGIEPTGLATDTSRGPAHWGRPALSKIKVRTESPAKTGSAEGLIRRRRHVVFQSNVHRVGHGHAVLDPVARVQHDAISSGKTRLDLCRPIVPLPELDDRCGRTPILDRVERPRPPPSKQGRSLANRPATSSSLQIVTCTIIRLNEAEALFAN